jgi:hypothetical protein
MYPLVTCMPSFNKCLFGLLAIFNGVIHFCCCVLWFLIYSEYSPLARRLVWRCFLPFCKLCLLCWLFPLLCRSSLVWCDPICFFF